MIVVECFRGAVDDGGVTEGALEDDDARAGAEGTDEFGLNVGPLVRGVDVIAEAVSVDQDVLLDGVGVRVVFEPGFLADHGDKVFELAVVLIEPLRSVCAPGMGVGGGGHGVSSSKHRETSILRLLFVLVLPSFPRRVQPAQCQNPSENHHLA